MFTMRAKASQNALMTVFGMVATALVAAGCSSTPKLGSWAKMPEIPTPEIPKVDLMGWWKTDPKDTSLSDKDLPAPPSHEASPQGAARLASNGPPAYPETGAPAYQPNNGSFASKGVPQNTPWAADATMTAPRGGGQSPAYASNTGGQQYAHGGGTYSQDYPGRGPGDRYATRPDYSRNYDSVPDYRNTPAPGGYGSGGGATPNYDYGRDQTPPAGGSSYSDRYQGPPAYDDRFPQGSNDPAVPIDERGAGSFASERADTGIGQAGFRDFGTHAGGDAAHSLYEQDTATSRGGAGSSEVAHGPYLPGSATALDVAQYGKGAPADPSTTEANDDCPGGVCPIDSPSGGGRYAPKGAGFGASPTSNYGADRDSGFQPY
jgi:hypothetical protein